MSYTPFTWHDGPGGGTPIVASRLNAIEQGIADAHDVTDALSGLIPIVAGVMDGAIVDHNLDVPSSPNGRYLRWESGLQLCFVRTWHQFTKGASSWTLAPSWVLPAGFVDEVSYIAVPYPQSGLWSTGDIVKNELPDIIINQQDQEPGTVYCYTIKYSFSEISDTFDELELLVGWIAVGVWK